MKLFGLFLSRFFIQVGLASGLIGIAFYPEAIPAPVCSDLLIEKTGQHPSNSDKRFPIKQKIAAEELLVNISQGIPRTREFAYLRAEAKKMGVRVWLFGGTAASYLHYVKWDLERQRGILNLLPNRFDYHFTNIFRTTQDIDLVVDGTAEQIHQLEKNLIQKFPDFAGKKVGWDIRSLRTQIGSPGDHSYREALLHDPNFSNQNSDTNSIGMVEISESADVVVRDLRTWRTSKNHFLEDALNNSISYLRNPLHHTTSRARLGENPEILSVVRLLVKAFQFDLTIDPKSLHDIQEVINQFEPSSVANEVALHRITEVATKLVIHSMNIERTMDVLDQLGLREKLLQLKFRNSEFDARLWLNKEPLRSFGIGPNVEGAKPRGYQTGALKDEVLVATGRTAGDLKIRVVAHETNSLMAFESITRSHAGIPNVVISRKGRKEEGEKASLGDGFYTTLGYYGSRSSGLTIRFEVDPQAREGVDFVVAGDCVRFFNKSVLKIIPEHLTLGFVDFIESTGAGKFNFANTERAWHEGLKRRLNVDQIVSELEGLMRSSKQADREKFEKILEIATSKKVKGLLTQDLFNQVAIRLYRKLSPLKSSGNEKVILHYIKVTSLILPELIEGQVLTKEEFQTYLSQKAKNDITTDVSVAAAIELALLEGPDQFFERIRLDGMPEKQREAVIGKIKSFWKSSDERNQLVFNRLYEMKEVSLKEDNIDRLVSLFRSKLIDINEVSLSGHSLLLEAVYYQARGVIDFLIRHPDFQIDRRNRDGRNDLEELRLLGKSEIADYIEHTIGKTMSKKIQIKERQTQKSSLYPEGRPIANFVRIEPGTFRMGLAQKVVVTLTKPFDFMSVETTQRVWRGVVSLIKTYAPGRYDSLSESPSHFRGPDNPVEKVSYDDITLLWLPALNELSKMDHLEVQESLSKLIPGHVPGKNYRLPTEAEWEYVARLGGLASGDFLFGTNGATVDQSSWHLLNSEGKTHPVGLLKPLLIKGNPIYGLQGNVMQWVQDAKDFQSELPGGLDPVGTSGQFRVLRGLSYNSSRADNSIGRRLNNTPRSLHSSYGFRLVSDVLPAK